MSTSSRDELKYRIANRLRVSQRRLAIRWQDTRTEVIIAALFAAVVMMLLISMVGGVLS